MTKRKSKIQQQAEMPQTFAALLTWHILNGTRSETGTEGGERWRSDQLAKALRCTTASIRNWRRGRSLPVGRYIDGLAAVFFGSNPSLQAWRSIFLRSWKQGCLESRYQALHRGLSMASAGNDGTMRFDKKDPEAVRSYVILQLSDLCHTLKLPLSGVDGAANHLLENH